MAITSMPSMPSVPLISARPSFSASTTGVRPASASASAAGPATPARIDDLPLADQRQRDRRQRREVAGAAERPVLRHDRGDAGAEHRGQRRGGLRPDPGAAAGQGGQPQQHQRADHLALHRVHRCRRRASGSARSAARPAGAAGSRWWPAHRSRWRCRSAGGRRRPGARRWPVTPSSRRRCPGRARPAGRAGPPRRPGRWSAADAEPIGSAGGATPIGFGAVRRRAECGLGLLVDGHRFIGCRSAGRRERRRPGCVRYTGQMTCRRGTRSDRATAGRGRTGAGAPPRAGGAPPAGIQGDAGVGRRHRPRAGAAPLHHLRAAHRTGRRRLRRAPADRAPLGPRAGRLRDRHRLPAR